MTSKELLLMDPGPVRVSDAVREAISRGLVSHRSPEFEATHACCQRGMAMAFGTERDPLLVNGNGWMGVETAMAGVLTPDDEVLAIQNGKFGVENGDIAERYAQVDRAAFEWGSSIDLGAVRAALSEGTTVVTMTHCETSTGVVNPVQEVAALADEYGALLFVDGISSIGGETFAFDDWGIDIAVTASQKALGAPPGLSAIALSDRARERVTDTGCPFSLNLSAYLEYIDRNQTPSTAPVPLYFALEAAIEPILDEGIDAQVARQRRLGEALRAGAEALDLKPYVNPGTGSKLSNVVQVLKLPEELPASEVVDGLYTRGISIRGGLDRLTDDVLRIATMGSCIDEEDVERTVGALARTLGDAGWTDGDAASDDGRRAVREALSEA